MAITEIADLERAARKTLPETVYAYFSHGSHEEETLIRNRRDLDAFALVPRYLNDVSQRSTAINLAGTLAKMPIALSPVAAGGLAYPDGEVEAALAARLFGVPFCLSTLSISTIEDVAGATRTPFWFQLYLMKDRRVSESLMRRAAQAQCSTLVLSLDSRARDRRHQGALNGYLVRPGIDADNLWDVVGHLPWFMRMLRSRRRTFGNFIDEVDFAHDLPKLTQWIENQLNPGISPNDIDWVRRIWPGKLLIKGVLHPEDAKRCVECGADGVIVSNQGGWQADGVISTIAILPQILDAVNGRAFVFVDSGIRSGCDVFKMMARGAQGCLVGRAYLFGLAADGRNGVLQALGMLHDELDEAMALCGVRDIKNLPRDLFVREGQSLQSEIGPLGPYVA